jgi:hypothetical protein
VQPLDQTEVGANRKPGRRKQQSDAIEEQHQGWCHQCAATHPVSQTTMPIPNEAMASNGSIVISRMLSGAG